MQTSVTRAESLTLDQYLRSVERRAFRVAEIATRNRADALDIVQDAMLKLVEKYGQHPANEWNALFQRILHSRIIDWHRRKTHRNKWLGWLSKDKDEEDEDIFESIPDSRNLSPERQLMLTLDTEIVINALQQLPIRQQQAFMLRIWEDMDGAQTAIIMGCSEGSVKTHLFRALNTLRAALGEAEE
ncbi:MAG TPA: RNA polymerase sigma factor [Pseudomonadales bacterium]|nr:RNA polymerase sigma factor [Pseudomonadales bacterium]